MECKVKVSTFAPLREGGHGNPVWGRKFEKKYFLFSEKLPYLCHPERVKTRQKFGPFMTAGR
ncbi:hypothetical protein [Sphingobacterium chuzhouense]|uniref:hypothetical protein n=1 Tax=Sphingobacterium chuzhouense TaxID=1742264 RepID=UPI0036D424FC